MEAEQIYEIVTKLVGNIRPQGCSQRDSESKFQSFFWWM